MNSFESGELPIFNLNSFVEPGYLGMRLTIKSRSDGCSTFRLRILTAAEMSGRVLKHIYI